MNHRHGSLQKHENNSFDFLPRRSLNACCVRATGADHLQPELRRRARHRAAGFEIRRERRALCGRDGASRAGLCDFARPDRQSIRCKSWSKIIATTRCRRNCCSRCSRARRLIFEINSLLRTTRRPRNHSGQNHPQRLCAAFSAMSRYGEEYQQAQMNYASEAGQPIIEVDGKLQFQSARAAAVSRFGRRHDSQADVELALAIRQARQVDARSRLRHRRLRPGSASYNLVSPEKGDVVDLVGWITMNNQSGKLLRTPKSN